MSVKQMAVAWELDIPREQKYVLLAYADHADHDGSNVRPSLDRIAWKTGYSKDQVRRISRKLVQNELMELVKAGGGRGNPPEYKLTLEKGSAMPSFEEWKEKEKGLHGATDSEAERVASEPVKGGISEEKGGIAAPPEPSIRNHQSLEPSDAPQGEGEPHLGKNYTTVTVDRVREVDFEPTAHQKATWGRGFKALAEVPEGQTPPRPREVYRRIARIVEAAEKGYFVSVERAGDEPKNGARHLTPVPDKPRWQQEWAAELEAAVGGKA